MRKFTDRAILLCVTVALCELPGIAPAQAGGFGVREQSAYFLGTAFAGSAAGGDISSMYWNSAATAASPGCNLSANLTGIFAQGDLTAPAGVFVTGIPPAAPGLTPHPTTSAPMQSFHPHSVPASFRPALRGSGPERALRFPNKARQPVLGRIADRHLLEGLHRRSQPYACLQGGTGVYRRSRRAD